MTFLIKVTTLKNILILWTKIRVQMNTTYIATILFRLLFPLSYPFIFSVERWLQDYWSLLRDLCRHWQDVMDLSHCREAVQGAWRAGSIHYLCCRSANKGIAKRALSNYWARKESKPVLKWCDIIFYTFLLPFQ